MSQTLFKDRPAGEDQDSPPPTNLERLLSELAASSAGDAPLGVEDPDREWWVLRRRIEDGSAFPWFLRQQ